MTEAHSTYPTIDLLKFIFALAIVALHTRPFCGNADMDYYSMCIDRIAVPFFFSVSSYLFWKKKGDIRQFVSRLLCLYLVWLTIYSPIVIKSYFFDVQRPALFSLAILLKNFLINSTFTASWFLMALIESMIIIWWFDKHSYKKAIWVTSIFLYALCLSSSMYYGIISTTSFANVNAALSGHFPWANSFAAAFLYVAIGKYLADHQLPNMPTAKLMIIELLLIAVAIVEITLLRDTGWRITDAFLTLVPLTTVTVLLSLQTQVNITDGISALLRKASTVIYVSHGLFIYILMNIFHIGYGAGLFFGVFFCSFALSMILIACSRKYKFFRYLM